MKVKFLGTAAAEGWPATFCRCESCKKAIELGGKNIRTRSQILVNDDLLVDLPPDTYFHKITNGLDLSKIKTLLVTHSHLDHFYPMELSLRGSAYAHDMLESELNVFCNARTKESYNVESGFERFSDEVLNGIKWNIVEPFMHFTSGDYEVWTLKAHHALTNGEKAVFYLIKKGDRAFMQCNDTGYILQENFDYLQSLGIKIDAIALDCTGGMWSWGKDATHMAVLDCVEIVERMRNSNFTHKDTKFVVTHFSHNAQLTHEEFENYFKQYDVAVAYDGMEIEV